MFGNEESARCSGCKNGYYRCGKKSVSQLESEYIREKDLEISVIRAEENSVDIVQRDSVKITDV